VIDFGLCPAVKPKYELYAVLMLLRRWSGRQYCGVSVYNSSLHW